MKSLNEAMQNLKESSNKYEIDYSGGQEKTLKQVAEILKSELSNIKVTKPIEVSYFNSYYGTSWGVTFIIRVTAPSNEKNFWSKQIAIGYLGDKLFAMGNPQRAAANLTIDKVIEILSGEA